MSTPVQQAVAHLFRHESGRMIAVLCKLLGLQHLQTAQDIVQDTLLQALHTWSYKGVPDNPPAWLHRVARNRAVDFLRREKSFRDLSPRYGYLLQSEYTLTHTVSSFFGEEEMGDSQLRMIFACCHPAIPVEAQIALALKTLCGLSVSEIARAFLKDEETISKRIYRAKEKIKSERIELDMPPAAALPQRLNAVLHCLYLLFNEGYNSSHPDRLIREDLCAEAMRLAYLLAQNPLTAQPRTHALLALCCFQASRLKARVDDGGRIVLLKDQDRNKWHRPLIGQGFHFLESAGQGPATRYHLEAAIAARHAAAPSFEATDWQAIHGLYEHLLRLHPTPFVAFNKAIAAGYALDVQTALRELQQIKGLEKYYLYQTALGDIHFEQGCFGDALACYRKALHLTQSGTERELLKQRIASCLQKGDEASPDAKAK